MPKTAKKEWTPEERAAFGAKMKAAREKKKVENQSPVVNEVPEAPRPTVDQIDLPGPNSDGSPKVTIGEAEYNDLVRQIEEIKQGPWEMLAKLVGSQNSQSATITGGKVTGTVERYPMGKELYPSPVERLMEEQKLQRFAFKINYELNYEIGESAYTTIDNVRMREPKFKLELIRVMMDEDTGEPTDGRYVVCQLIMHEDHDTALVIARELGMDIEDTQEEAFLNEMRYIRMRDWLLECFYPPKIETKRNRRDMVIDGRLVSYFEVNAEEGKTSGLKKADWENLPKIKF